MPFTTCLGDKTQSVGALTHSETRHWTIRYQRPDIGAKTPTGIFNDIVVLLKGFQSQGYRVGAAKDGNDPVPGEQRVGRIAGASVLTDEDCARQFAQEVKARLKKANID